MIRIAFIFFFLLDPLYGMELNYGEIVSHKSFSPAVLNRVRSLPCDRNVLYCSINDKYYWNNIYPAGRGSNLSGNIALRDMSDLLELQLGYNYRDSGVADSIHTIQTLLPMVNQYGYNDCLDAVFADQFNFLEDTEEARIFSRVLKNISKVLDSARCISNVLKVYLNVPSEGFVDNFVTLADVERVSNLASQQIMTALAGYLSTVMGRQVSPVLTNYKNLFKNISTYFEFAHTEYESWYDVTMFGTQPVPEMLLVSRYDMCDPQDKGYPVFHHVDFLGCERFLARHVGENIVTVISLNKYYDSRSRDRSTNVNTFLQIDFR